MSEAKSSEEDVDPVVREVNFYHVNWQRASLKVMSST